MGNNNSSQTVRKYGGQPTFTQSVPQLPSYHGLPIFYHHEIIEATLDVKVRHSFLNPDVSFSCTNVEQYYPTLAAMYDQGMLHRSALPLFVF